MSDTHGVPPAPLVQPEDFDVIVHSGDLMPNRSFGNRAVEELFQPAWMAAKVLAFPDAWRGKPLLFCPGNHDFIDPTPFLREAGFDARSIANDLHVVDGVRFWGHPWTPAFCEWNWMCSPEGMAEHLRPVARLMERGGIDVLVSHGPAYAILDKNDIGEKCGCKVLRDVLREAEAPPQLHLHGHIHESAGVKMLHRMKRPVFVSNAAATQRIVTVKG